MGDALGDTDTVIKFECCGARWSARGLLYHADTEHHGEHSDDILTAGLEVMIEDGEAEMVDDGRGEPRWRLTRVGVERAEALLKRLGVG